MNVMAVAYSVSLKCDLYTLFVLLCLFNLESIKVAIDKRNVSSVHVQTQLLFLTLQPLLQCLGDY